MHIQICSQHLAHKNVLSKVDTHHFLLVQPALDYSNFEFFASWRRLFSVGWLFSRLVQGAAVERAYSSAAEYNYWPYPIKLEYTSSSQTRNLPSYQPAGLFIQYVALSRNIQYAYKAFLAIADEFYYPDYSDYPLEGRNLQNTLSGRRTGTLDTRQIFHRKRLINSQVFSPINIRPIRL